MLLFVTLWIYVKYLLNQIHRSKESNVVPVTRGKRKWESFANRWNWKGYENLLIHKRSRDLLFDTVPVSAYFLLLRTQNENDQDQRWCGLNSPGLGQRDCTWKWYLFLECWGGASHLTAKIASTYVSALRSLLRRMKPPRFGTLSKSQLCPKGPFCKHPGHKFSGQINLCQTL